ncbi:MAG: hypothetical protein ACUZ77_06340 [Candidatus Brocadiales bacterium]
MNLSFALLKDSFILISGICIILILFLTGCQTGRTATVFGLSGNISDGITDPAQLNRELEDILRKSELKRMEELRAAPKSRE